MMARGLDETARRGPARRALAARVGVLLLVLGGAGPALARPWQGHPGRGDLSRLERGLAQLGLPAEKEQAVAALLDEARPQLRTLHDRIQEAQRGLRERLEAEAVDEAAVLAQADAIGVLRAEARKTELQTLLRVRALLSPKEREQLKALREQRRGRWRGRGGCGDRGDAAESDA